MNLSGVRIMSERWNEASGLSSRLASVVLYDGETDRVLNGGHRLVMVSVCLSAQKRFGYDCMFCKNIQWFRMMCLRVEVALHCCITNLRGQRWRSWLRHCATSQKVAGSIPDGVIGSFH